VVGFLIYTVSQKIVSPFIFLITLVGKYGPILLLFQYFITFSDELQNKMEYMRPPCLKCVSSLLCEIKMLNCTAFHNSQTNVHYLIH